MGIDSRFEFATTTRIIFGAGTLADVPPLAAQFGKRALVVTGSCPERAEALLEGLAREEMAVAKYSVAREPTIEMVEEGTALAREAGCDVVLGFGGGSAIDAGKAIAALLANPGHPLEYLEVIGQGRPLARAPLPYIAIPTTAGTGAEVTRNAVLLSPEHQVKVSLRSLAMLPRIAVVDPELTYSLPPETTASTGLDALAQLIEPFVSHPATPITHSLCREGIRRAGRSLRRAYSHGDDAAAREDMSLASLCGGLALANAKLGAVHGLAGPLGGMIDAPHGALCGRLLPHVMAANVRTLRKRMPQCKALARYDEIARLLTGDTAAAAEDGVVWVDSLCSDVAVPPLRAYGLSEQDFPLLIEKATASSSMKGNPIALGTDELLQIVSAAL
ncbi:MAG: iron-containing alcohol dehydrogenase [Anaerolineales bacterium]|nr:MAG: iron-containing alcohol dehydrogenase [Anaerolineales bacterium]